MHHLSGFDRAVLDRARLSRDPRFDGKFFIAVTSTGIYCRPICPVRSPKMAHIRYYATAAAAAAAGFRPCLRCRPEAAPGTPAWRGTSAVVHRALRLIDEGVLDRGSVEELAARVGMGSRHLHRLFVQHVGASPVTFAQTRRLHFAKRLLDETTLPVTEIALASGFQSLRRFNAAFQATYARAPRDLRNGRRGGPASEGRDEVSLRLAFRPPYDWTQVRSYLAARAVPGIERVDPRSYARTVASETGYALVYVRALEGENALELRVRGAAPTALFQLSSTARRTFDLAADPARIAHGLGPDPLLAPLLVHHAGLRIPGVWDPFECAVRALLGEQQNAAAARRRLARLVARAGRPTGNGGDDLTHVFPSPGALAAIHLDGLGLSASRALALRALARVVADGLLDLAGPVEEVAAALHSQCGFDASMVQYVALRGLGDPDAFPSSDSLLRHMAAAGGKPLTTRGLEARAEAWRPWRGYATLHLWCAAMRCRAPAWR